MKTGRITERSGTPGRRMVGIASVVGLVCCLVLSAAHLFAVTAPGCGPRGGCGAAIGSVWATVPWLHMPVAFIGAAYFAGMLAAAVEGWAGARGPVWLARGGTVAALTYLSVGVAEGIWCPYCIASHASAIAIWVCIERASKDRIGSRSARERWSPIAASILLFGVLFGADRVVRRQSFRDAARQLESSVAEAKADRVGAPFTGRYRVGPERAVVRMVIFTDYQCPDCRNIEQQVERVLASHPEASFSVKHFPFCSDCNRHVPKTMHPNACWAARAAEAAGELGGNEAFWKMHRWLFSRGGSFTNAELNAALPELGFETRAFVTAMNSAGVLEKVMADVEEGVGLGLRQTPMVFVNGVELRGWQTPNALALTADQIAAAGGSPTEATADSPPTAVAKAMADWKASPYVQFQPCEAARSWGDERGHVSVVVFGDYQEKFTAVADARVRALARDNAHLRYEFRHFPVNSQCNPAVRRIAHPMACRMARAAEAAAIVGGSALFWPVHEWILDHQRDFTDAGLRKVVQEYGGDVEAFMKIISIPEIGQRIQADCVEGGKAGLTEVPAVFINGRLLSRWNMEGVDVLRMAIEDVRAGIPQDPTSPD